MKKLLFLFMILILLTIGQVCCAEGFTLSVDDASAKAGETVTLDLTLSDNPGIIAARFEIRYDKERLQLIKAEDKKLLQGGVFSQTVDKYPYIMLFNSASPKNFTENGTLATLTFKIPEDAESGDAFIYISYNPDDVYDVDLNNVAVTIKNCNVKVEGKPKPSNTNTGSGSASVKPSAPLVVPEEVPPAPTENNTEPVRYTFSDVSENDWFYEGASFVVEKGLMKGTSDTDFSPSTPLTRGMLVTILYRNEDEPTVNDQNPFKDVDSSMYYASPVIWAKKSGIVNGISDTEFSPDTNITREQIVFILYNYAKQKKYDTSIGESTNILSYDDFSDISEYAIPAMQYALGSGIMKGNSPTTLNPSGNATRAEIATILHRFLTNN